MKCRRIRSAILPFAVAAALAALPVQAAMLADAPAPAATQKGVESLKVTIAEVSGNVQVRSDDTQPWQPAKVGAVVGEGAEFRTGPRSSVRCTIPPDQSFTLDRLGTVKVLQALKDGNKLKTDMLMKYGRTKYSVEAAGLEHEGTIASPSGTLAVRGTVVSMYDQPPFVPEAVSYTGQAHFRDIHRQVNFGGANAGKQTLDTSKDSAAETALNNGVIDPKFAGARTNSERQFIASEVARGGVVSFDPIAQIAVVTGGTPIRDDNQLVKTLPGKLDIVARWFGPADVNLEVFVDLRNPLQALLNSPNGFQASEFLYPGYGLNHSKSGGTIPFDHRGGPNGGTEIAFWNTPPKGAVYGVGALLISGNPVDLKINAFLDGKKQFIYYIDNTNTFVRSKTLEVTLDKTSLIGGPNIYIPNLDDLLGSSTPTVGDGSQPPIISGASSRSTSAVTSSAALAKARPAFTAATVGSGGGAKAHR